MCIHRSLRTLFLASVVLAGLAPAARAVEFTSTFNDGIFWANFTYRWTITAANAPPPGATELEIDLDAFPVDQGTLTSSFGTNAFFVAGPPAKIRLARPGGLLIGNWIEINSGCNPRAIMGLRPAVWKTGGGVIGPAPMHLALHPTLPTPGFSSAPSAGQQVLSGTAGPGSYIDFLQNDPTQQDSTANLLLATVHVSGGGTYSALLSKRLTAEHLFAAVTTVRDGKPDTSQIVLRVSPASPMPGIAEWGVVALALLLLLTGGMVVVRVRRRSATSGGRDV